MSIAELQVALAGLPELERGSLAAWLLDSLPPHGDEDGSADGIVEAARRRSDLDSGRVQSLSTDEFWDSIERLRATWK